ncbi:hypothetical protein SLEP1_g30888 [Rubroshorea leprosula]|uniref:Uncharacterized protein n=1 Tax=Rubroshorea leprosula TaxID=152421 RepID=A0AAV5K9J1_9ROSI|nr:hypothetical protein SLEP1_g30888 [Rubroshorea leprosula]
MSSILQKVAAEDLGCTAGPNTFTAMQDVIKVMKNKYQLQRPESKMPEFQVFFNDQASNDFNILQISYALPWLSQVPEELLDKQSAAWNKGRVHYTNAPDEVVNAYASQFGKDMKKFLDARAKEIVVGGRNDDHYYACEDQVDSFNLPMDAASPVEMAALVEKNGHFSIERSELTNTAPQLDGPIDIPAWVMHVRAAMEEMFTTHFEDEIIVEMFNRLANKLLELSDEVESRFWKRTQLLLVLMRK